MPLWIRRNSCPMHPSVHTAKNEDLPETSNSKRDPSIPQRSSRYATGLWGSYSSVRSLLSCRSLDWRLYALNSLPTRTILSMTYGINIQDPSDYFFKLVTRALTGVSEAAIPGTYLVDAFPLLKYVPEWFPGAAFKRKAALERQIVKRLKGETMEFVKNSMVLIKLSFVTMSPPLMGHF